MREDAVILQEQGAKMSDQEQPIRDLAYLLWEEAGRPEGRSEEFWHAAVARLTPAPKPVRKRKPAVPQAKAPAPKAPTRTRKPKPAP
jgi:hypothetical protein